MDPHSTQGLSQLEPFVFLTGDLGSPTPMPQTFIYKEHHKGLIWILSEHLFDFWCYLLLVSWSDRLMVFVKI